MLQRPFKILIVDDDPDVSEILSSWIDDIFPKVFDITILKDPLKALTFTKNNGFLIVITDVNMPNVNGESLNLQLKNLNQGVRTIILTGGYSYMTAITCFRDGADGFISKPLNPSEIEETLQRVLDTILSWETVFKKVTDARKTS